MIVESQVEIKAEEEWKEPHFFRCHFIGRPPSPTPSYHSTLSLLVFSSLHCKKKVREFPVPSRDVTTKLSLGGNNDVITELFLPRGSLVSDIPETGNS